MVPCYAWRLTASLQEALDKHVDLLKRVVQGKPGWGEPGGASVHILIYLFTGAVMTI